MQIINGDCRDVMKNLIKDEVSVDLVVTSPPYDKLRDYEKSIEWNFDVFKEVANQLYRVVKDGSVVVWVVGDSTINGSETGSSFKQALYFKEIGFNLHDTMIYEKNSSSFPAKRTDKRYTQIFEYMFVFCKGKIRDDIKLLCDKKNKLYGKDKGNWGKEVINFDDFGNKIVKKKDIVVPEFSMRNNIWVYNNSMMNEHTGHPATFPEQLAKDHILSWSNEGDLVLDPFMGSGTTAKMCVVTGRNYIGFEQNPNYMNIINDRMKGYTENKKMKKFLI